MIPAPHASGARSESGKIEKLRRDRDFLPEFQYQGVL